MRFTRGTLLAFTIGIGLPLVSWFWWRQEYERTMFVPRPADADFAKYALGKKIGEHAESLKVVWVDRDVNNLFLVINGIKASEFCSMFDPRQFKHETGPKFRTCRITGQSWYSDDNAPMAIVVEDYGSNRIYVGFSFLREYVNLKRYDEGKSRIDN